MCGIMSPAAALVCSCFGCPAWQQSHWCGHPCVPPSTMGHSLPWSSRWQQHVVATLPGSTMTDVSTTGCQQHGTTMTCCVAFLVGSHLQLLWCRSWRTRIRSTCMVDDASVLHVLVHDTWQHSLIQARAHSCVVSCHMLEQQLHTAAPEHTYTRHLYVSLSKFTQHSV